MSKLLLRSVFVLFITLFSCSKETLLTRSLIGNWTIETYDITETTNGISSQYYLTNAGGFQLNKNETGVYTHSLNGMIQIDKLRWAVENENQVYIDFENLGKKEHWTAKKIDKRNQLWHTSDTVVFSFGGVESTSITTRKMHLKKLNQ